VALVACWGLLAVRCTPAPVYRDRLPGAREERSRRPAVSARPVGGAAAREAGTACGEGVAGSGPASGAAGAGAAPGEAARAYQTGLASYYGEPGEPTASGAVMRPDSFTAAHRELPFGTIIRVTNLENGRWVDVEVNDRGPFAEGRIVDLSRAAADRLGMLEVGSAQVRIEIVSAAE